MAPTARPSTANNGVRYTILKFLCGGGRRRSEVVAGGKAVICTSEAIVDVVVGDSVGIPVGISGEDTRSKEDVGVGMVMGCIELAPPPVIAATNEVIGVAGAASVRGDIVVDVSAPQAGYGHQLMLVVSAPGRTCLLRWSRSGGSMCRPVAKQTARHIVRR